MNTPACPTLYPYPLRDDPTPRPVPPFGLCCCFDGLCRGGQVVAGRLANGTLCRCAIPPDQRPIEAPTASLQRPLAAALTAGAAAPGVNAAPVYTRIGRRPYRASTVCAQGGL